jgi:ABC-2 type transport system ATP-binding protein
MMTAVTDLVPARTTPDPIDAVIVADHLTKLYPGDVLAVDALCLEVGRGEIFGLLGPNGAGKTTTAGMFPTRVVPTSGRAIVEGVDVWKHATRAKRLIGVVPQSNTLDRVLSVEDNLFFHGRFFGMSGSAARAECARLLTQFRLADRAKAPVTALSGGMAQRLMLARAVMHHPSILFLDEHTAGLDPQSRIAVWEILRELHRDGQTIILTTHYMEEADELCDRLAIVDRGRAIALGTPAELKASAGPSVVVSITATGDLDEFARGLRTAIPGATTTTVPGGLRLGTTTTHGVLPIIIAVAETTGITMTELSIDETTLEHVFLELTGKELRE